MKTNSAALLSLLLCFACGNEDDGLTSFGGPDFDPGDRVYEPEEPVEPEPFEGEIGQARQALSAWDGYGLATSGMVRCWHDNHSFDWAGGGCYMPSVKKIFISWDQGSCNGGTYGARYTAAITSALSYMKGIANNRGWTVLSSNTTLNPGNGPMMTFDLKCGGPLPGQGATAQAATVTTSIAGSCSNTQDGQLCRYGSGQIRVVKARIENADFTASGTTNAQREVAIDNIVAHELGHMLGLGHEPCSSAPGGAQLMDPGACQSGLTTNQQFRASVTQFEKDMLFNFSL